MRRSPWSVCTKVSPLKLFLVCATHGGSTYGAGVIDCWSNAAFGIDGNPLAALLLYAEVSVTTWRASTASNRINWDTRKFMRDPGLQRLSQKRVGLKTE